MIMYIRFLDEFERVKFGKFGETKIMGGKNRKEKKKQSKVK